jgi:hypothetical protein
MPEQTTVLLNPDLHDGFLRGIVLSEPETVELLCSDVKGHLYTLRLAGLVALRADNFLQGNVIFEVNEYRAEFPRGLIKRVYGEDAESEPDWLSLRVQELSENSWTLLEVTTSYGCELLALARGHLLVEAEQ